VSTMTPPLAALREEWRQAIMLVPSYETYSRLENVVDRVFARAEAAERGNDEQTVVMVELAGKLKLSEARIAALEAGLREYLKDHQRRIRQATAIGEHIGTMECHCSDCNRARALLAAAAPHPGVTPE
jgi:hypothetical protein